jgi:anti-sigma B factor antagonist
VRLFALTSGLTEIVTTETAAPASFPQTSPGRRRFSSLPPVQSNFAVDVRDGEKAVVIGVRGELDLASSPALEQELESGKATSVPVVIVDLRGLEFMDSTGLSVLVRAHQRATENGQQFAVVRGSQQVQRLLTLTGVAERLTLVDSPEEL